MEFLLSAQADAFDQLRVTVYVLALEVIQQPPAFSDHDDEAAPGMVIMLVDLEVFGEVADPFAQNRDLHLGRTGVARIRCVLLD